MGKMNFLEAMQALLEGNKVYNTLYPNKLFIKSDYYVIAYGNKIDGVYKWYNLTDGFKVDEIDSDWYIYEEPVEWSPKKYDSVLARLCDNSLWVLASLIKYGTNRVKVIMDNEGEIWIDKSNVIPLYDKTIHMLHSNVECNTIYNITE